MQLGRYTSFSLTINKIPTFHDFPGQWKPWKSYCKSQTIQP